MTDKERILTDIIQVILLHKHDIQDRNTFFNKNYKKGNILVAFSPYLNNWTVSFFDHYDKELNCLVVRDIITGKLCNYFNEMFTELPKEWFNKYIFLTGKKYKILEACKKCGLRFHSLDFDDENETFTFKNRLPFHNEAYSEITISTKLSLKEIKKELAQGNWVKL